MQLLISDAVKNVTCVSFKVELRGISGAAAGKYDVCGNFSSKFRWMMIIMSKDLELK